MENNILIASLFLLPFLSFVMNGLLYKKNNFILAGCIGSLSILGSFICATILFTKLCQGLEESFSFTLMNWFSLENFKINFSFEFNKVSSLMALIITGVGFLIYLFSFDYMKTDKTPHKYFSYLSLFIFNMLVLVLGDNLLVSFVGWEGVGLSSYLLIGYWYKDRRKSKAGMKAFVVNRIGDAGFIIGMAFLLLNVGSLDYNAINSFSQSLSPLVATAAVLSLFIGVCGKSAQAPLHIWLPDAMAGPTPVSALIHAATMVTAGVFVLFRLNGLVEASEVGMQVIGVFGAATALFGAFSAISQKDIKKILAYSTISQLGFMILAIGVGAYTSAVFHLLTHAFFKALLFLGAGSIIHNLKGVQNINEMGGLKNTMPITHFSFLIGFVSIIGVPFTSGFFSKDEILFHVFYNERGSVILWAVAFAASILTAVYMTRLMFKVFWNESSFNDEEEKTLNDGGVFFKISLMLLSILTLCSGFLGVPSILSFIVSKHFLHSLLNPMLIVAPLEHHSDIIEWVLMFVTTFFVLLSVFVTYVYYANKNERLNHLINRVKSPFFIRCSKEALFLNGFFMSNFVRSFVEMANGLWIFIDETLIDRVFTESADSFLSVGKTSKFIQSGNVQAYISIFVVGVSVFIVGALFL